MRSVRHMIRLSGFHSFALCLITLAAVLDYAYSLNCFFCTGNAAPLCEGETKHQGVEDICPPWNQPGFKLPYGATNDSYVCFIMRTKAKSTGNIEIIKGCTINDNYFVTKVIGGADYLKPGECYEHDDEKIYDRQVTQHQLKICICDTDLCNKDTMNGTGYEDIEAIKARKTSGVWTLTSNMAWTLANPFVIFTVFEIFQ